MDDDMLIDHAENTYRKDGTSADFHRCEEGWRLWMDYVRNLSMIQTSAVRKALYRDHVERCEECIAMTGRFAE